MLTFKLKNRYPPGGKFFYVVPETETYFESRAGMPLLVTQVQRHYEANKIDLPENLECQIEDYICRNVSDGFCEGDDEGRPRSLLRNLTFWSVRRASAALLKGQALTPDLEAEQRVVPCISCAHNLRHMCTTCSGLRQVVRGITRGKYTKVDDYVGVCASTGCLISAMVFRQDGIVPYEGDLPEKCWMREVTGEHGKS